MYKEKASTVLCAVFWDATPCSMVDIYTKYRSTVLFAVFWDATPCSMVSEKPGNTFSVEATRHDILEHNNLHVSQPLSISGCIPVRISVVSTKQLMT
jgi:hypothetical protein